MRNSNLVACLVALILAAGCKDGGGDNGDEDTWTEDTTIDEGVDVTEEPDVVGDVLDEDVVADVPTDEGGRDCTGMYPGGPFGWKGSIRYNTAGEPYWDGNGDYLENVYLLNTEDEPSLPAQFYCSEEVDILFYDFTAMWCPPCNQAASEEHSFIAWMEDHGWTVAFLSVLEEDMAGDQATRENAITWKTDHGIVGDVLYDPMGRYHTAPFRDTWPEEDARGWPSFFIVNPDNMLIWATFSGWRGTYPMETFFTSILELFEMGAENDPEYIP